MIFQDKNRRKDIFPGEVGSLVFGNRSLKPSRVAGVKEVLCFAVAPVALPPEINS